MFLMSSTNLSSHTGRHNKQFFLQCSGERQNIFETINNYIPRLTLLIKIFIHTYNHSFAVLSAKSINTVSLPWKLSDFLDTSFSWTLSFPLGPYFSSFLWGPFNFILLQFVGLHPTVTTRLISGRACLGVSTIKSAALMSPPPPPPQGQPSGPGCYL